MEPEVCPWCGCQEQYTDWYGTCARCKVPWDRNDWRDRMVQVFEKRIADWQAAHSADGKRDERSHRT